MYCPPQPLTLIGSILVLALLSSTPKTSRGATGDPEPPEGAGFSSAVIFTATGARGVAAGNTRYGSVATRDLEIAIGQKLPADVALGVGYSSHQIVGGSDWATVPLPDRLQSLVLSVSCTQPVADGWSGTFTLAPGCYNAGNRFSSDGFGLAAMAVAVHTAGPSSSFAVGVAYNSLARGSRRVLPVLGTTWKPAGRWTIALGFPATAVTYAVSDQLQLTLGAEGVFDSYFVDHDPLPAQTGRPSLARTRLEYSETRIGLMAQHALTRQVAIFGAVGVVLDRSFDYHERHFKLTSGRGAPAARVGCSATL